LTRTLKYIGEDPEVLSNFVNAVASGTLADGSAVIVNANGTVSVIEGAGLGSITDFGSGAVSYGFASTFDSNSNKVVITYDDGGNSGYGTAIVGTVSGSSISFGTAVVYESAAVLFQSITFDSNSNKVVIAYTDNGNNNYGTTVIGTVSGTGISFGTPVIFDSAAIESRSISTTFDSNSNKVVIFWRNDSTEKGRAVVGTVSGTGISFGTPVIFNSVTTHFWQTASTFDSNSNKVVVVFRDQGGSDNGEAIVGTVNGTNISFGSPAQYDDGNHNYQTTAFDSNSNKIVVAYQDGSDSSKGKAVVGTVSGTNISFGTPVVFDSGATSYQRVSFDSNSNVINLMYRMSDSGTGRGYYIIGTVSGTGISFGTRQQLLPSNDVAPFTNVFDSNSNKTVMVYYRYGSSAGRKAGVYSAASSLTAENYIGISDGVYASGADATIQVKGSVDDAQSSLTPGQSYFVQTDGTLGTTAGNPSVFAGTAVASTKLIVKG